MKKIFITTLMGLLAFQVFACPDKDGDKEEERIKISTIVSN